MLAIKLLTFFKGELVGEDENGNRYYQERFRLTKPKRRPRRWVIYRGTPEASRVQPEWYGWLHFTHDSPLEMTKKHAWQKTYEGNMTGTPEAYRPSGHVLKEGAKRATPKAYEPWTPS